MRSLILVLLVVSMYNLNAQTLDSVSIKQVDSLILVSIDLAAKKDFDKALEVIAFAEIIALETFGRESAAFGSCTFNRGRVNHSKGDYTEAEKWYTESKAIRQKVIGNEHPDYAISLNNLAEMYFDMGNYQMAEPLYLEDKSIRQKVLGNEHPDYVSSLISLAVLYYYMGNYEKAEPLFLEVKVIQEKVKGVENNDYATTLNDLAMLYESMGNYSKAEQLLVESLAIKGKVLGKEHPEYAACLGNLALLYNTKGDYGKAETLTLESLSIIEKGWGKEHPDYATSLGNLASLYQDMGNYEKAILLLLESKAIREKVQGKEHPEYALCLSNLAGLYSIMSDYGPAESVYLESKAIREKVQGKEHPEYGLILIGLAKLYKDMGYYERAEPLALEAIAIQEKLLGKEHLSFAIMLSDLANLYYKMGNYEKAEPFYNKAKVIIEKILGKDHPYFASILVQQANLQRTMGNYEKAELLCLESKAIREKTQGKEHPHYGNDLSTLANIQYKMGNYKGAESLTLDGMAIKEKVLGKEHPEYALLLGNLAIFTMEMGNYEKAESLHFESISIKEKTLGKEHPDYSTSLHNLAMLYETMGNYEKAEPLYLESKVIDTKVLGKEHPTYASTSFNLAALYEIQFRFSESTPLMVEALHLSNSRITNSVSFLSEKELSTYASTQQSTSPVNAYLFARPVALAKILPALSYDQALFQKGFLMNAARRLQALSITSTEASTINNYLKGYRRRLAAEYTKPIAERKGIAELEENANLAEKELARTVAGYADALRQVKWEEVKSGLKQQEAAIEFVYFEVGFPQKTDSMMYAALLILPGAEQPMFIPLFEEKELQKKMSKKITPQHQELVAQMYTRGLVPLGGNNNQEGLYDLLWKPLDSLLAGIKKIYYSPAGMLHQINFNAIPVGYDANDEVLILADKYELVRLGSTRSIVVPDVTQINAANEMSLYGGIHYEIDTTLHTFTDSILHKNNNYPSNFTYALRSVPNRGGAWNYLPGTEHEIAEIFSIGERAHYPISIYQGSNAKEETVKELGKGKPSPRILHIATHGFFFPNPVINKEAHGLGATESIFKLSDNPMIRSGLMLAGSNYTWKKGRPWRDGMEDGILTAYEISQMNLSNTELVVLSACETGLGDIQGNEGVYGLQRAFKIAGAKYLMMSLWQVPDEETKEFMIGFYKNWLEKKLSIPDAFRITQKEMHEKYTNPYLWAGFVLVE